MYLRQIRPQPLLQSLQRPHLPHRQLPLPLRRPEAVSAHHGWVVGALDSAHQAVLCSISSAASTWPSTNLDSLRIEELGKVPDELYKETVVEKVVLGYLKLGFRLEARGVTEKRKTDPRSAGEMVAVRYANAEAKGEERRELRI